MAFRRAIGVCDHGRHKREEDAIIMKYPFYGAIDALSAPHSHREPPMLFDGRTGGEMIAATAVEVFQKAKANISLESYTSIINIVVGKTIKAHGLPLENAGRIPGACFAIAKVKENVLNFLQFGDCLIFWRYRSGKIGYTPNPVYSHEKKTMEIREEILRRNGNNEEEMWTEFAPILAKLRQQDINNPQSKDSYYVLNGQPILEKYWNSFSLPIENLEIIILCSDGFFPYEETSPERLPGLAKRLINDYQDKGLTLEEMLIKKRTNGKKPDEATGIVLEFS